MASRNGKNVGPWHCLTKCALENKQLNQNGWSWYHFSQVKNTSYTDTRYCIHILWEACCSVLIGLPYTYANFPFVQGPWMNRSVMWIKENAYSCPVNKRKMSELGDLLCGMLASAHSSSGRGILWQRHRDRGELLTWQQLTSSHPYRRQENKRFINRFINQFCVFTKKLVWNLFNLRKMYTRWLLIEMSGRIRMKNKLGTRHLHQPPTTTTTIHILRHSVNGAAYLTEYYFVCQIFMLLQISLHILCGLKNSDDLTL